MPIAEHRLKSVCTSRGLRHVADNPLLQAADQEHELEIAGRASWRLLWLVEGTWAFESVPRSAMIRSPHATLLRFQADPSPAHPAP